MSELWWFPIGYLLVSKFLLYYLVDILRERIFLSYLLVWTHRFLHYSMGYNPSLFLFWCSNYLWLGWREFMSLILLSPPIPFSPSSYFLVYPSSVSFAKTSQIHVFSNYFFLSCSMYFALWFFSFKTITWKPLCISS